MSNEFKTVPEMQILAAKVPQAHDGEVVNQCDGCMAGFPVDKNGHHVVPYPSGSMACEKNKYTAPPRVVDVDLLKMLVRIRDDKTWRTNDNSLWPDLLALIRKHESALEKP